MCRSGDDGGNLPRSAYAYVSRSSTIVFVNIVEYPPKNNMGRPQITKNDDLIKVTLALRNYPYLGQKVIVFTIILSKVSDVEVYTSSG